MRVGNGVRSIACAPRVGNGGCNDGRARAGRPGGRPSRRPGNARAPWSCAINARANFAGCQAAHRADGAAARWGHRALPQRDRTTGPGGAHGRRIWCANFAWVMSRAPRHGCNGGRARAGRVGNPHGRLRPSIAPCRNGAWRRAPKTGIRVRLTDTCAKRY